MTPNSLADLILEKSAYTTGRLMVGIAGPPASGKTTLATELAKILGPRAACLSQDAFHFDNTILRQRDILSRKGAPQTFDVDGFAHCLRRILNGEEVAIPVFDRSLELSRAAAAIIGSKTNIVIVEGNYLLLNQPPWLKLRDMFDLKVFVTANETVLVRRLVARWTTYERPNAEDWIANNDLPNARTVISGSSGQDILIDNS